VLKRFLYKNLYRHYRVMRMASKARRVVTGLFEAFSEDARLLPPNYQSSDPGVQARLIAHYIAGMTDRYALKEYRRLFVVDDN
jgi:dGTPase